MTSSSLHSPLSKPKSRSKPKQDPHDVPGVVMPRRPLTPSSLRDVDLSPDSPVRKYAAPLTGHDLMAMFPPAPPDRSLPEMRGGTTNGFFDREERAFFAQAGKEIVRVCVLDFQKDIDDWSSSKKLHPHSTYPRDPFQTVNNRPPAYPSRGMGPPVSYVGSTTQSHRPRHSPHSSTSSTSSLAGTAPAPPPGLSGYPHPPPPAPSRHQQPPTHVTPSYPMHSPQQQRSARTRQVPVTVPVSVAGTGASITSPGTARTPKLEFRPHMSAEDYDDEAWRRPIPYAERRRAGKHTRRIIVRS